MTRTSQALRAIAEKLDIVLQRVAGRRMGFSLIVWNESAVERANYISNCPRPEVVKALEQLLARWKAGMPDVPGHNVN
ncbi:MAG: hypothetical protein LCH93_13620 [Proteobacteria bacterium]|nr:hypothetical protein [Pseudomonadota bacterium]